MHTFKVVKEPHGWAVRMDVGMSTPFWSRAHAIREADGMCEELRRHGVRAEVIVDDAEDKIAPICAGLTASRLTGLLRRLHPLRN